MMYTLEELRLEVSKLMEGNCKAVDLKQMKEVLERNNKVLIEFGEGYLIFDVVKY